MRTQSFSSDASTSPEKRQMAFFDKEYETCHNTKRLFICKAIGIPTSSNHHAIFKPFILRIKIAEIFEHYMCCLEPFSLPPVGQGPRQVSQ